MRWVGEADQAHYCLSRYRNTSPIIHSHSCPALPVEEFTRYSKPGSHIQAKLLQYTTVTTLVTPSPIGTKATNHHAPAPLRTPQTIITPALSSNIMT